MKYLKLNLDKKKNYNLFFSVTLILIFLFVLFMSGRQGLGKLEDNFFQKNYLVENFNRLSIKVGDHVFPNALIGKNGWIEYTGDGNIDDYQNAHNFSPEALQAIAKTIDDCYRYAQDHNITFLIVIAPNKASIYPDMLPEQIRPLSNLSRLDQLNDYLRIHNVPEILDLRPALRDARQKQDVYYKRGTHWNEYGAYVGYEAIVNILSKSHPDLIPYSANFFRFRTDSNDTTYRQDNGVAHMMQLNYLPPEQVLFSTRSLDDIVHKIDFSNEKSDFHKISWIPGSNLPSLLIFHDSFGNLGLNNYLSLNFSRAYYIHVASTSLYLNKSVIEQFAPRVMIYERVERNLQSIQYDLAGCAQ